MNMSMYIYLVCVCVRVCAGGVEVFVGVEFHTARRIIKNSIDYKNAI